MNYLKIKNVFFTLLTLLIILSLVSIATITTPIEKSEITNDTPFSPTFGISYNCVAVEPLINGSNVYISNTDSFFVSKFDSSGNFLDQHFIVLDDHPTALACSIDGKLYVGKQNGGIDKYSFSGDLIALDFIRNPKPTCIYPAYAEIYVADIVNQRIGKYSSETGYAINANFITNINALDLEILDSNLFVATGSKNTIRVYNRFTGVLIDSNIVEGYNFQQINNLTISGDSSLVFGSINDSVQLVNNIFDIVGKNFNIYALKKVNGVDNIYLFSSNFLPIPPKPPHWDNRCKPCSYLEMSLQWSIGAPICKTYFKWAFLYYYNILGLGSQPCPDYTLCGIQEESGQYSYSSACPPVPPPPPPGNNICICPHPDIPLPVELSSFTATVNIRDVVLNWSTTSELNNYGYQIERATVNNEFTEIGFVNGMGTVYSQSNYSFEDKNLLSGRYIYRLKQIDFNGNFEFFDLSDEVVIGVPNKFSLHQNFPNPFNPVTKIRYDIPVSGNVNLKIYDNTGREINTLVNEYKDAGYYTVEFSGSSLASGVYYYKIETGNNIATKKMVLLK